MFNAAFDKPHVVYSSLFLWKVESVDSGFEGWDINKPKDYM